MEEIQEQICIKIKKILTLYNYNTDFIQVEEFTSNKKILIHCEGTKK